MELISQALVADGQLIPFLVTLLLVLLVLAGTRALLRWRWRDNPEGTFRIQLLTLGLTTIGMLLIVVELPVEQALRLQLLSLFGVVLSAAIALSSTTFIGNMMAGIMLKAIRSARPGDFITVGDVTGRITEMDLLHTEQLQQQLEAAEQARRQDEDDE
jgi:small conductance mechanosensitive channel